ncbi:FAD-binding protein [Actinotalea sp. Marseille-Q4924]|uniref:FAD-binding protein n=1 Tax=Actinotalea sp. Marseille-Q4924 TaxID=2866571 RepID=UPI001CE3DDA0|nr:FAD-binding protein [Actinotalea sp. Marseille-Q4924]
MNEDAARAEAPGPAGRNWAGNLAYRAQQLHEPRSLEELRDVVVREPRLRALGSRHSFTDVADGDALVSLDRMPGDIEVDADAGTVRLPAGTRYGTLAAALHERGWAVHNLASLPHISVAGAVATGTHGSGDRSGTLATAVRGLELVTADGEVVGVGAAQAAGDGAVARQLPDVDLDAAVVGLGALGVVTAVTLAIEPTFDVAQEVYPGVPWDDALADLDAVTGSADSVSLFTDWRSGAIGQVWRKSRVVAGWEPRTSLLGVPRSTVELHPLEDVDPRSTTAQLGVPGPWHERLSHFRMEHTPSHGQELQTEYLVPREHAVDAIGALRRLGPRLAGALLVSEVRTMAGDQQWLSGAYGGPTVGFHFTWRLDVDAVAALLPHVEEALGPFSPRPHWAKLFTVSGAGSPTALRAAYPRFDDFRALAARLDPQGRFHNAFLERHGLVG